MAGLVREQQEIGFRLREEFTAEARRIAALRSRNQTKGKDVSRKAAKGRKDRKEKLAGEIRFHRFVRRENA